MSWGGNTLGQVSSAVVAGIEMPQPLSSRRLAQFATAKQNGSRGCIDRVDLGEWRGSDDSRPVASIENSLSFHEHGSSNMRRRSFFLLSGLLMGGLCGLIEAAPPISLPFSKPEKSGVKWQDDLRAAHKIAMEQNKPMLVVFGADWCGYCKKLERETLAHPQLAQFVNDEFIPVHLDADKEERVVEILGVKGLPCTVILSPKADEISRIEGYHQSSAFYQKLTEARRSFQQVQQTAATPDAPVAR